MDYKFDRQIRQYGKILSVDFTHDCERFVTGTNSGYVCFWDIKQKQIIHKYKVINPVSQKCEQIGMIKWIS